MAADDMTQPARDASAAGRPATVDWLAGVPASEWTFDPTVGVATGRPRRRWTTAFVALGLCLISALGGGVAGASLTQGSTVARDTPVVAGAAGQPAAVSLASPGTGRLGGVASIVAAVAPSVVTIEAQTTGFGRRSASESGSGFVVGSDGWILSCDHVVAGSDSITVMLHNGRTYEATIAAEDVNLDLVLLKIKAKDLHPAQLAGAGSVVVGQEAIVIGSPLGDYPGSVTEGIISGIDRSITVASANGWGQSTFSNLLQTDAAINPGNSGGPLFDAAGRVVGIVSAESGSAQGIGFAVPVELSRSLLAQAGL